MITSNNSAFNKILSEFRRSPFQALVPGSNLINQMIHEWGNMNWSAHDEFLASCVRNALKYKDRPILECGSGLTTIILGIIAEYTRNKIFTLENSEHWSAIVTKVLEFNKIASVELIQTKLKDYGDYEWYDINSDHLPEKFGLFICDGPPGDSKGGRMGLLFRMRSRMDNKSLIILDDAIRPGEQTMAEFSKTFINSGVRISGIKKPFFKIFPYTY